MEEIRELLKYSIANKDITIEEYVKELVRILINNNLLQSYLKYVGFLKKSKLAVLDIYSVSAFDMTNDGIIIFKYDFEKVVDMEAKKQNLNDEYKRKYMFYRITQAMLHEVEHVKQKKMFFEGTDRDDLEYKLVYLTLRHLFQKYPDNLSDELINKYQDRIESTQFADYSSSPTERFAEIKSNSFLANIVDEPEIKYIFRHEVRKKEIRGYNTKVSSPTIYFFKNIDREDILKTNSEYKGYKSYLDCLREMGIYEDNEARLIGKAIKQRDLYERLFYGLPISNHEYKTLIKK